MDSLNVKLESFEGPLDLLCHLIEKNEINIYDIPIAHLAEQYIDFLSKGHKDMEAMSEFVLMAATLLEIKSKMLLPKPKAENEEEVDPRAELAAKIEEYKKFKLVAEDLKEQEEKAGRYLYKTSKEIIMPFKEELEIPVGVSLEGINISDIHNIFINVLSLRALKTDKIRSAFNSVERDMFTIEDKINYISDTLKVSSVIQFSQIFSGQTLKIEIVVTFLALLELIKMKLVHISQKNIFDEIFITCNQR